MMIERANRLFKESQYPWESVTVPLLGAFERGPGQRSLSLRGCWTFKAQAQEEGGARLSAPQFVRIVFRPTFSRSGPSWCAADCSA